MVTSLEHLWKQKYGGKHFWERLFGEDFLLYERKRLREVAMWYNDQFLRLPIKAKVPEVVFYAIPIELTSAIKAAIADKGNYACIGLSVLREGLQCNMLMLLPSEKTLPQEYSLIRITNAAKDFIECGRNSQWALVVEDFETLDSDYVYLGVELEKNSVQNFISENLIQNQAIGTGFQAVISGSPYVVNGKGGIALSSFNQRTPFTNEFIKTLKLMQPPEYSDLFPSKNMYVGKAVNAGNGVKYLLAERIIPSQTKFEGLATSSYDGLRRKLWLRNYYKGEFSIACSLTPEGDGLDLLSDIFSKFVGTEVTQPFSLQEELYSGLSSFDLAKTQNAISEELILQVANQRQLKPSVNVYSPEISNLRKDITTAWQISIEETGYNKQIEPIYKSLTATSLNNILRVAQSIARDTGKNGVGETELGKSFRLFNGSLTQLMEHPWVRQNLQVTIPEFIEDRKFNAVRIELSNNPSTIQELFPNVASHFKDLEGLQTYLDKLLRDGQVYMPQPGRYLWLI